MIQSQKIQGVESGTAAGHDIFGQAPPSSADVLPSLDNLRAEVAHYAALHSLPEHQPIIPPRFWLPLVLAFVIIFVSAIDRHVAWNVTYLNVRAHLRDYQLQALKGIVFVVARFPILAMEEMEGQG